MTQNVRPGASFRANIGLQSHLLASLIANLLETPIGEQGCLEYDLDKRIEVQYFGDTCGCDSSDEIKTTSR